MKFKLNRAFREVSGELDGLVYRNVRGKVIVSRKPDMSNVVSSDNQIAQRERFKQAAAYGKAALANPTVRALYDAAAKSKDMPVFAATIADFYTRELKRFFDGPRNFWWHLFEIRRPANTLLNSITDLNRYANEKERAKLNELADLVRQKDGLDYHHAIQSLLKAWLFVHIPLTYSLLLFSFTHVVLVFAFSGDAR